MLQIDLPHSLPAPWPGITCVSDGRSVIDASDASSCRTASASVMPSVANAPRSGRPTSPANRKSPEKRSRVAEPGLESSKQRLSRVCPGVWRAWNSSEPTLKAVPAESVQMRAPGASVARSIHACAGPSAERYAVTAWCATNAGTPLTKSACTCVSATATMRSPSCAATDRKRSMSHAGSMTMASRVAGQPTRYEACARVAS